MSSDDGRAGPPARVLLVSLHTSPLLTPGTGDAGGLNVYVLQTALHLARRGVAVDVATRATTPEEVGTVRPAPGVEVHHLPAGPLAPVPEEDLPAHVDAFARELAPLVARAAADGGVVHSHYWLSGVAALRAREMLTRETPPPLVHTMHTVARVKNRRLAPGERPEPAVRVSGEDKLVARADLLVINTADEKDALVALHAADAGRVMIVAPGVDLQTFRPGPQALARAELGLPGEALILLLVGRIQPLKAPDVLLRAAGELLRRDPLLRDRLLVAVLGGPSGSGLARPEALADLVDEEGLDGVVHFGETLPRAELARWYRAADLLTVPSHHESFGLVAVEALASGTPVVAARVGGLPHAVGEAGVLVDGHGPHDWADALAAALAQLAVGRADWSARAVGHARQFSWDRTVDGLIDAYRTAGTDPFPPTPMSTEEHR